MRNYIFQLLVVPGFCMLNMIMALSSSAEMKPSDRIYEREIYLLTGSPTPKSSGTFPTSLYKIGHKKIALARNIVSDNRGTLFIHYYHDKRVIIIAQSYRKFIMVKMDDPLREFSFEMNYSLSYSFINACILDIPDQGLYLGLYLSNRKEGAKLLLGMHLSEIRQKEFPLAIHRYGLVSGIPGVSLPGGNWFYLHQKSDGQLIIPKGKHRIQTEWRLPDFLTFSEDDIVVAYVNNSEMLAVTSRESSHLKKSGELGFTTFYIFDKKLGKWHSVKFPGAKSQVRGFGPWLAGYVADADRGIESPGRKDRRQKMTATGRPLDWYLEYSKTYSPGILFLYNVHTRRKYTIRTNQGDNEVLLIEGNIVYYRANRSIYKAEIEKDRIGKGELLVQDDLVPDIHWAFIGP